MLAPCRLRSLDKFQYSVISEAKECISTSSLSSFDHPSYSEDKGGCSRKLEPRVVIRSSSPRRVIYNPTNERERGRESRSPLPTTTFLARLLSPPPPPTPILFFFAPLARSRSPARSNFLARAPAMRYDCHIIT